MKFNIQNASPFKTKQLGDKLNKVIMKNTTEQTIAEVKADIIRTEKHTWYCELIIAACVGASLTLVGVIAHMMITGPAWTW
jgi:hypothetical protein